MKDVQCKKNRNEVMPVSAAVKDFEAHNTCLSCQYYDRCREEKEQAEIDQESN